MTSFRSKRSAQTVRRTPSTGPFRVIHIIVALTMGFLGMSVLNTTAPQVHAAGLDAPSSVIANSPYWMTTSDGYVSALGGAAHYGDLRSNGLNKPIVGMAPTPDKGGYWLVASDGGIFAFGNARFFGSTGSIVLNKPIVAIAPTPTNNGYWLIATDGGIFCFGDAAFYGSTGSLTLNKPIVGMTPTVTNKGYWLTASDGGIFAFGDARFYGSTGSLALNEPIVSMAASTGGYWLVARDGGIFAFGDAKFYGSAGGSGERSYQRIIAAQDRKGYWLVRNGGDVIGYGSAVGAYTPSYSQPRPAIGLLYEPTTRGERAIAFGMHQLDKPYIWGGNGPVGYDCSGFTSASWRSVGVSIPRVANDQYDFARHVQLNELRAGDLVFFSPNLSDSRAIDHVAMYVGGGWAIESGGVSKPSRVAYRNLGQSTSRLMTLGVRPAG